jgi:hypothetical protein
MCALFGGEVEIRHNDTLWRARNAVVLVEGSQLHLIVGPYLLAYRLNDRLAAQGQRSL